jgi:polyphosphate kinase
LASSSVDDEGAMTGSQSDVRWDVSTPAALRQLTSAPLPLGLRASPPRRGFHRDLYYDTADGALRERGVTCRFRIREDDRRELLVSLVDDTAGGVGRRRYEAVVTAPGAREAFEGTSEPARILASIVSPAALRVEVELEVERYVRTAAAGWLRRARFELRYDVVTVRAAGLSRTFQEMTARELRAGSPGLVRLSEAIAESYGLRSLTFERRVRGAMIRGALESEALARGVGAGRSVVVLALDGPDVACVIEPDAPRLPSAEGSGEEACRHLMRRSLGSAVGDLHLLTTVPGGGQTQSLEVWIATRVDRSGRPSPGETIEWLPLTGLLRVAAASELHDPATLAALAALKQSGLHRRFTEVAAAESRTAAGRSDTVDPDAMLPAHQARPAAADVGPILDGDLSLLEFNARVLALAEDPAVPLLERVRYLSIVGANLDEFFMVRVGGLKYGGADVVAEGDASAGIEERLTPIGRRARELVARQYACFDACRGPLAEHGVRVRAPESLTPAERDYLRAYFRSTVFPYLTPRAITATPGYSLPVIPDLALCMAIESRDTRTGGLLNFAELTLPGALPRFVQLPGGNDFVAIEEVVRPELPQLYRGRRVEHAYLFRLSRYADLGLDGTTGNLAQAVEEGTNRRRHQPVVRVEVERAMPASLRHLLLRELQLEPGTRPGTLGPADLYEIDGLMDLTALRQLAGLPMPELRYPPFIPRPALDPGRPIWETIREGDVLVHHPFQDFAATVQRFFMDAADDPDVAAIKVALYRAGERSPIVDALLRAALAGKQVTVFVELKARFDEQRNVRWAKQLEAAGVHVVQGVRGAKNHAKVALVIRREGEAARSYVHIGTGNYNADTARAYTDLGLLSARESLCADIGDLFNGLTGASTPAAHEYRECLVAPTGLLPGLIARIDREAEHARAGRGGHVRMKLNGLSDREVVHALYRASQAGVQVDLVVRGICTVCPGVPGVSDRIRVVSVLGRFLEHARIYHFANGGEPEYFIGSADARPRNLRRRVEVLAPIHGAELQARLAEILDLELADPTAWVLDGEGRYTRRAAPPEPPGVTTQARLMGRAADAPPASVG